MKTVDRYVLGSFLVTFSLTFVVLSFVMTIGSLSQIARHVKDGGPALAILQFAAVGFHETLQWSIPLTLLFTSVLVFSRLTADSELMAMRACGFNAFRIVRAPLLFALVMTAVCAFFNCEIQPRENTLKADLRRQILAAAAMRTIVPGHVVNTFPRIKFIFDAQEGDELVRFRAWERGTAEQGEHVVQAERARLQSRGDDLLFIMNNVTADQIDEGCAYSATADAFCYLLPVATGRTRHVRNIRDMRFSELWEHIGVCKRQAEEAISKEKPLKVVRFAERALLSARLALSMRLVFAAAGFVFALVGMGLGMNLRRSHSTVGFLWALAVAVAYYIPSILVTKMDEHPSWSPEFLIWLPVFGFLAWGWQMIRRCR